MCADGRNPTIAANGLQFFSLFFPKMKKSTQNRMLYLGLPVQISEAYRIFGKRLTDSESHDYGEELTIILEPYGMDCHYIDDGVCILGYLLEFAELPKAAMAGKLILEKSTEFKKVMKTVNANLDVVTISFPYGEDSLVRNPEPYLIQL